MLETTLCYIFKDEKVLMLYRNKKEKDVHEGKWNGLGGKVEVNETALECVIREVLEESGLKIGKPILIGACYYPNFNGLEEMMYVYVVKQYEGEISECDEGELHWIMKNEIMNLNVWESDRLFLPYVLNEEYFVGQFQYDDFDFVGGECKLVTPLVLEKFIESKKKNGMKPFFYIKILY